MTKEERKKIIGFITSMRASVIGGFSRHLSTAKLTQRKDILLAIKNELLNFGSVQERITELNDVDYRDLLNVNQNLSNRYFLDELPIEITEQFILKTRKLFMDEFLYEAEHNLLPGAESQALFGIPELRNILYEYDNEFRYDNYTFEITEVNREEKSIKLKLTGYTNRHKKVRNIEVKTRATDRNDLSYSVDPSPRNYHEKAWLDNLVYTTLLDYASLSITAESFISDIELQMNDIMHNIVGNDLADADSVDVVNQNGMDENDSECSSFNPESNIRNYSHRFVSIPIMGSLLGVELEYKGDKTAIFKFRRSFQQLNDLGWILERDSSVDFEMKSPAMELDELKKVVKQNIKLFQAWSTLTDPEGAGLHFHVSMDDCFSIKKRPASKTLIFMLRIAQMFETTILQDSDSRKAIFKRDYQHYCDKYGNSDSYSDRYRWVNFNNLNREEGKTLEIRLFSSAAANELDKAAEEALLIVKFFKSAIRDWRIKNRPEFIEWKEGFGEKKLLKNLMKNEELKQWLKLFAKPIIKTA